jgi:hypothetical protein
VIDSAIVVGLLCAGRSNNLRIMPVKGGPLLGAVLLL